MFMKIQRYTGQIPGISMNTINRKDIKSRIFTQNGTFRTFRKYVGIIKGQNLINFWTVAIYILLFF